MEFDEQVENWLRSKPNLENMDLKEIYDEIEKESVYCFKDRLKMALVGIAILKEEVNRLGLNLVRKRNSIFIIQLYLGYPENTLIYWITNKLELNLDNLYFSLVKSLEKTVKSETRTQSKLKCKLLLAVLKERPKGFINFIDERV